LWAAADAFDDGSWDVAVARVLGDVAAHIARVEHDLFPATLSALAPGDWEAVELAAAEARNSVG
jgi:hypothetical protein